MYSHLNLSQILHVFQYKLNVTKVQINVSVAIVVVVVVVFVVVVCLLPSIQLSYTLFPSPVQPTTILQRAGPYYESIIVA